MIVFSNICRFLLFLRFNKKPRKGIRYLQEQSLLGPSADDIAEFFHNDDRLNKVPFADQSVVYFEER